MGLELVAVYLGYWAIRKARQKGGRLEAEVDLAMDLLLDRLHEAVVAKLGPEPDPSLTQLEAEAEAGEVSSDAQQWVELTVGFAAKKDPPFADTLTSIVAELQAMGAGKSVSATGDHAVAAGGNISASAQDNSFATVSGNFGALPPNPPGPWRASV